MKSYIYHNQLDGRSRIVIVNDDGTHTSKSYPRYIVEQNIGRKLLPNEDVHHIDGDVTNNDISNLEIVLHGEHQRQHMPMKYKDAKVVCVVCGKEFIFTAKQQRQYNLDLRRHKRRAITCSRSCSSKFGAKIKI